MNCTPRRGSRRHHSKKAIVERARALPENLSLGNRLVEMVRLRVAQICKCQLAVDVHTRGLLAQGESIGRIQRLKAWRESSLYDDRERAALAVSEALGVNPPDPTAEKVVHEARTHL